MYICTYTDYKTFGKKKRRHVLHLCTATKEKKKIAAPQRRGSGFWVQQFLRVQRERWPGDEKVGVAHRPNKGRYTLRKINDWNLRNTHE